MPISLASPDAADRPFAARARARLTAYAARVLRRQGVKRPLVTVVLADDRLLRELYRRYKRRDRATDVLSFTYEDAPAEGRRGRALSGEIYVSRERLFAQALRYRHTPGKELLRLVTHGLLHLCGHDHMKPGERKVMRAAERAAMAGDLLRGDAGAFESVAKTVRPRAARP
jgi:probable rRNA maturation factor